MISNLDKDTVSLVVTSCKRHDLLYQTLNSFVEYNTYPLNQVIIVEDSDIAIVDEDISRIFKCISNNLYLNTKFIIVNNGVNLGQMKSIDKAYALVNSKYIFHCEDDWEFYRKEFIEKSMVILKENKDIFTVWLRAYDDLNGHTVSKIYESGDIKFRRLNKMGIWTGFTLNPGLRLTENCLRYGPYSEQEKLDPSLSKTTVAESDLAIKYANEGYVGAVTTYHDGFVKHSGFGHHISNPWENKVIVKLKNFIRRIYGKI
ncbi:glycosyltransferase family 2 protein [Vibrio mimicus]|uniref:glycosyltransferase n=1 Tax=Vibrio mimicus TaxID=674 RepID=UPI0011DC2053|nr:glycosyltransferase [Vibrio mimicus]TXZ07002.1 glycosyltransferase family 2 protein [Vibrio mimicus]BCN22614.1 putative glycosyltransferase [Vibrio mimicus]BCN22697.1 putative glycosyltransferase [Vibrio mimicus]